jgi:hypothetical protein
MMIEGRNVRLYVYRSGVPALAVCATNVSKTLSVEQINITTVDSGRENEYIGGSTDSELTLDGVRTLDEITSWQADDFEDQIGEVLRVILIYTNFYGDVLSYDGNVLITGVDDSNPAAEFSTYSISMIRSGAWTKLKSFDSILVDGLGNPILDGNGDLIRV